VKGALVGGLVAQRESELFLVDNGAGFGIVAGGFEIQGAAAEPVMLGHGFDERGFGEGFGLVFFAEGGEERVEFGLRFAGEDTEGSGQAMAGVVQSRDGFTHFGFRTAGQLGVFAIGLDLEFGWHLGMVLTRESRVWGVQAEAIWRVNG